MISKVWYTVVEKRGTCGCGSKDNKVLTRDYDPQNKLQGFYICFGCKKVSCVSKDDNESGVCDGHAPR